MLPKPKSHKVIIQRLYYCEISPKANLYSWFKMQAGRPSVVWSKFRNAQLTPDQLERRSSFSEGEWLTRILFSVFLWRVFPLCSCCCWKALPSGCLAQPWHRLCHCLVISLQKAHERSFLNTRAVHREVCVCVTEISSDTLFASAVYSYLCTVINSL